ncbi:MAG TPA: SIMPL domain-containing protein [Granulicella sp.]|jgi:hypothetical protein
MKTLYLGALVLFAATLPAATIAQTAENPAIQINKDNRTISISATDHAEADPDVADLHVGFTVYGPTLQEAYKAASDSSNGITKAMLDAGATRSEIQSQSQRVSRLSDYEIKTQKGMKFSVQQSWTVSVDPKNAALILDAAVQAGANQSGDINWRLKNSVALDAEAVHLATEHARALAAELAKGLDVTLGKPLYATNSVTSNFIGPRPMMSFAKSSEAGAPAPLAIEAQRVQSTATVQIIYAIE